MAKIKYQATFADGAVLSRSSDRGYTHAWRIVRGAPVRGDYFHKDGFTESGFSGSAALAQKAVAAQRGRFEDFPVISAEVVPALVVSMKAPA